MTKFKKISYELHASHYKLEKEELSEFQQTWLRNDTVDYWRHYRMCAPVIPFAKLNPGSSWITIGDGRLGLDSVRLKKFEPSLTVLPTDISTVMLEKAKKIGLIDSFSNENAEELSFEDESFDYCFCKESFHHFPRPFIALYEMIRVARKAVILIEPADDNKKPWPLLFIEGIKFFTKKIIRKEIKSPDYYRFEESGNYVYTVSERDIQKVAIGLQFPMIGLKYYNDYYEQGVEILPVDTYSKLFEKVKLKIQFKDFLCKLGLATYTGVIAVVFKEEPSIELSQSLKKNGFNLIKLPANPFLNIGL